MEQKKSTPDVKCFIANNTDTTFYKVDQWLRAYPSTASPVKVYQPNQAMGEDTSKRTC